MAKSRINVKYNNLGHIISIDFADPDVVKHADDFLAHHGVKGQKWGVRRKRVPSSEHQTLRKELKPKKAKELSDDELKKAIGRMQLEKQYKDLNPKGFTRAHKAVLAVLAVGVTANTVMNFSRSPAGQIVKDSVEKALKKHIKVTL